MAVNDYLNRTVYSADGDKIGNVDNVFVDEGSDNPEWLTVKTGLFGSRESFVPIAGSTISEDRVVIPFSKDEVKSAPNFETDQPLSESDESQLYSHYRMAGTANGAGYGDSGTGTTGGTTTGTTGDSVYDVADNRGTSSQGTTGHDTSGPNTDDAMTRSEERLAVGTETVQTGKARLRKYIVTENVTQTVPVSHEEVRIEREPITEANVGNALSGPELSEEEHEVTLTGERVVTNKETVPVERVRLTTDTVQGEETVDETVRKEQIDTVYPDEPRVSDRERADKI